MVVTDVSVQPFTLTLADPLVSASGELTERRGFLLRYGRGIGEATPLAPWTELPSETATALEAIDGTSPAVGPTLVDLAAYPSARHAFSLAVADHHARTRNRPLYRYLGGPTEVAAVSVNATIDATSPAAVARAGRQSRDAGYEAVKLKVDGADPASTLERVGALREAIGETMTLRLDANGSWTPVTIREHAEALSAHDPAYLEQPTPGIDAELIADLIEMDLAVAIDEGLSRDGLAAALRSPAAALVIKPMAFGGPDRALAAARAARTCGLTPIVSDLVTGAVSRTACAHLAAALNPTIPAGLDTGRRLAEDLMADPPAVIDGRLAIPSGAGLGLEEVRVPNA